MPKIIATEQSNPDTINIDLMDSFEIATAINNEDKKIAFAIEKVLPQIGEAIEMIANAFWNNGRLGYFGAGTSGRLGVLDSSECWPTFGTEHGMVQGFIAGGDKALRNSIENAEDSEFFANQDLSTFKPEPEDVIVGISASGNPQYVLTILERAKRLKCKTIAISSNPNAKSQKFADIFICPLVGQEVIAGSSRMKSGTAQKMILNMLSTGAMIRIGKIYKNYMVDVRTTNIKLKDRAARIVSEIAKVSRAKAEHYLEESGNSVKIACIMALKKCSKKDAEKMLNNVRGIIRKIL